MNRFKFGFFAITVWAAHLIPGISVARGQQEISLRTGWAVQSLSLIHI